MNRSRSSLGALLVLLTAGCIAKQQIDTIDAEPITTPKIVALDAPRLPWVIEIEKRLRQRGFKVLRTPSRAQISQTSGNTTTTFNAAEAHYTIVVDGEAATDWAHRCFGGGWDFDYLNVALVDNLSNETLVNASDAGYSEGCPPAMSSMFDDIVDAVTRTWH